MHMLIYTDIYFIFDESRVSEFQLSCPEANIYTFLQEIKCLIKIVSNRK